MTNRRKLALISTGYLWFPCESGTGRMYDVASYLADQGFEIDAIVPGFQHHQKAPRDKDKILKQGYPMNIIFVDVPPYEKNISLARIRSNKKLKKGVVSYLKDHIDSYDAVLLSIPPNDVAAGVAKLCSEKKVPLLVDVEDLWPEAMRMVLGDRAATNIFLRGFERDASVVYGTADAVMGTSPDYRDIAFKYTNRQIPARTVYVGCDIETFDSGVEKYADKISKFPEEIWVTYAGSISNSYDIKTLVEAGRLMKTRGYDMVKINILGNGTNKAALEEYAKVERITNVRFLGFTPYQEMAAVLNRSDILINSFVKGAPQSIVNKVGDYLAAGRPMVNTLENPVFCKLVDDYRVGLNVEAENPSALADTILTLVMDGALRTSMGENARRLCEDQFDRRNCNKAIRDLLEVIIKKGEEYAR